MFELSRTCLDTFNHKNKKKRHRNLSNDENERSQAMICQGLTRGSLACLGQSQQEFKAP